MNFPDEKLDEIVKRYLPLSDLSKQGLTFAARACALAQELAPSGPVLEIGTRCGGSALAFLDVLAETYPEHYRPMMFTVDPYGAKPYLGGEGNPVASAARIYGDPQYLQMKEWLAPYPYHAHFLLRGADFLRRLGGCPYWLAGHERTIGGFSFAFLDGDHDYVTIDEELGLLMPLMHPNGIVLVDNVDKDISTDRALARWQHMLMPIEEGKPGSRQALVTRASGAMRAQETPSATGRESAS